MKLKYYHYVYLNKKNSYYVEVLIIKYIKKKYLAI
jgi:hypothetical protein